ncbi:hypothetical protein KJ612_00680 [Myxococcota bacterium]|nr:hypothetical protein [Myxococcota bacterium]MBU1409935.1 hypothetical protein [Myxococcota bacterium]
MKPGDFLVCYLTRVSRWVGLLRVEERAVDDHAPIFTEGDDPFFVRFKVTPVVWLAPEQGIPIHDPEVWSQLSMTREHKHNSPVWTGFFRTSLNRFDEQDGHFLEEILRRQAGSPKAYTLTDHERKRLVTHVVKRTDGPISVVVPDDDDQEEGHLLDAGKSVPVESRESIRVQAMLSKIGVLMGLKIWLPVNDRSAVFREWHPSEEERQAVLDSLPLNYDLTTLGTIERIDVLWIKGRSIIRAFEVEHTTAIYSGLLRMADLLSLQPNLMIKLHIVAPEVRRNKVFEEIRRPVFSLLEPRPMAKSCTYLSYDSVRKIAELPHIAHFSDSVLDEYAEEAE